jgi:hypothetical protein
MIAVIQERIHGVTRAWGVLSLVALLVGCPTEQTPIPPPPTPPTPPPTPPPITVTGAISGQVSAPSGVDIKDTVVLACYLVGTDACDDMKTAGVAIQQSGSSAAYTIPDLAAGDYVVIAAKVTLDAAGEVKTIDYLGGYGSDSTRVQPPASNIDIALKATATNTPPAPPSTTPAPAGKVSADVVGSWTSQASGTDIYAINTDGTYSRTLIDTTGCYRIERREAGNAVTSGNQITFYPTSNFMKVLSCGSYSEDRSLVPITSFTYRFETDPINANRYLFLTSPDGSELQYRKE